MYTAGAERPADGCPYDHLIACPTHHRPDDVSALAGADHAQRADDFDRGTDEQAHRDEAGLALLATSRPATR